MPIRATLFNDTSQDDGLWAAKRYALGFLKVAHYRLTTGLPVRIRPLPMTRVQFANWQTRREGQSWTVDCSACNRTHRVIPLDYFLEGDPPPT